MNGKILEAIPITKLAEGDHVVLPDGETREVAWLRKRDTGTIVTGFVSSPAETYWGRAQAVRVWLAFDDPRRPPYRPVTVNLDEWDVELLRDLVRQYLDGVNGGSITGYGQDKLTEAADVETLLARLSTW